METRTDIDIYLHRKGNGARAKRVVADMIKLYYLDGISTPAPRSAVYDTFIRERERLRAYPDEKLLGEHPDCALARLSFGLNTVHIRQCSDLQRDLSPADPDCSGFFYDVCLALAREIPTCDFHALSRFSMTGTDRVEKIRASYDTEELIFEQISGMIPFDNDRRDGECPRKTARWKLLPRCIAVNGVKL